ncbi:MAG: hypothetical protein VB084_11980 [Syntrophomonadaceae bacterium]|nr:hypothetical protein [Syntrophomonadaceae bacterium]
MKPYTTVQLNMKVMDTSANQIKRLAVFNQITVAERLRRFIKEGLAVNSNAQHIDMIASLIRQELMAIYHPADIQRWVAGQLEETLKKFEHTQRKNGKAVTVKREDYALYCRLSQEDELAGESGNHNPNGYVDIKNPAPGKMMQSWPRYPFYAAAFSPLTGIPLFFMVRIDSLKRIIPWFHLNRAPVIKLSSIKSL